MYKVFKDIYKSSGFSTETEEAALSKIRKEALENLKKESSSYNLWKCICLFADYPFITSGRAGKPGVEFKYTVPSTKDRKGGGHKHQGEDVPGFGNELFIKGRERGISRSSVNYALGIVRDSNGRITGPKQLKIYGSSYVYAIFRRFGLI